MRQWWSRRKSENNGLQPRLTQASGRSRQKRATRQPGQLSLPRESSHNLSVVIATRPGRDQGDNSSSQARLRGAARTRSPVPRSSTERESRSFSGASECDCQTTGEAGSDSKKNSFAIGSVSIQLGGDFSESCVSCGKSSVLTPSSIRMRRVLNSMRPVFTLGRCAVRSSTESEKPSAAPEKI